jgi:hypothetical protein
MRRRRHDSCWRGAVRLRLRDTLSGSRPAFRQRGGGPIGDVVAKVRPNSRALASAIASDGRQLDHVRILASRRIEGAGVIGNLPEWHAAVCQSRLKPHRQLTNTLGQRNLRQRHATREPDLNAMDYYVFGEAHQAVGHIHNEASDGLFFDSWLGHRNRGATFSVTDARQPPVVMLQVVSCVHKRIAPLPRFTQIGSQGSIGLGEAVTPRSKASAFW